MKKNIQKLYGKSKGITLIALIITIIILVILAGVAISTLTGENGLLNRIKIAKERHNQSEAEEKLKLKIMELQTNIIQKEDRQAILEDLYNWTNLESEYYDSEILSIEDSDNSNNKLINIDLYIFEIDENFNIIGIKNEDVTLKTETTYLINSKDGDTMQITVKIKNKSGIERVITPEGREITPQVDKTQIGIDYKIISGNDYIFKVKVSGSEKIKSYELKADTNAKPEIQQNDLYAYPLITKYGIEISKNVEIDYGDNINNYYSIDNGETWNKYDESFAIVKECNIIAKSVIEGEITREDRKEIKFNLAGNLLGPEAYDGNEDTFFETGYAQTYYMNISKETWNNPLAFIGEGYNGIWFLNSSGKTLYFTDYFSTKDNTFNIPENTTRIKIYSNWSKIYRIGIKNEPKNNS